ncbi:MAG TPA: CDP-alcohol phosphatidyltransferase family protein [Terriglobia bacterium]|nr:CDP-alcohol phosphatidyltransferase family protein [Terriglobia bacterium]
MLANPLRLGNPVGDGPQAASRLSTPGAQPAAFRDARRAQQSLTAGVEKRLLVWLAVRTPFWLNSDHLTALGFVSMVLAGACYAISRWHPRSLMAATFFIGLNWLGDSLDGTLARVRHAERPRYGFYVDHVLDMFGTLFLTAGLAVSGYVDGRIAAGVFVAYLMLSVEVYLATHTLGVFHLSFWKFGPTELRILLAVGNLALWVKPMMRVAGLTYRLMDFGGSVAIAGLVLTLIVTTAMHTVRLYREETRPWPGRRHRNLNAAYPEKPRSHHQSAGRSKAQQSGWATDSSPPLCGRPSS